MLSRLFGKNPSVVPKPSAPPAYVPGYAVPSAPPAYVPGYSVPSAPPAYVPGYAVSSTAPKGYTNAQWNAAMNGAIKEETEKHHLPTSFNRIPVIPVTEKSMLKHNMIIVLSKAPIRYISESATKYTISLFSGYPILRSLVNGADMHGEFLEEDGILRFIDQRTTKSLYQRRYYVYTFAEGGRRRTRRKARKSRGSRRKLRKT